MNRLPHKIVDHCELYKNAVTLEVMVMQFSPVTEMVAVYCSSSSLCPPPRPLQEPNAPPQSPPSCS